MHFATVFGKQLSVTQSKPALVKEDAYYLGINSGNSFHNTFGWVAKKGQEKVNNSRFYTCRSDLEIRSSTALKFLTIVERKAKD